MRALTSLMVMVRAGVLLVLSMAMVTAPAGRALADGRGPSILRDAEIETIIRDYANPLFRAAGLPPDLVTIRLLNDSSLNAFVTSGNRMFIHSGLILRTETPGQLIGVIAHETGHIAGGHIARIGDEIEKAAITSLAALALGAAAGVATGSGDVGMATMALGQTVAQRNFFAFSRTQESSADAFAMKVLDATDQSAAGLLEFFEVLEGQEILASARQDPYVRTHPLTAERISALRHHVETAGARSAVPSAEQALHDRMVAKLFAFLQPQGRTFQRYPETDESVAARYARSIAYFRRGQIDQALPLIDGLIAEYPQDPYFYELRGQMLVENGRVRDGLPSYQKAVELAPNQPLIAVSYGHALIESGEPAALDQARTVLSDALHDDPANAFAWRLLGMAAGRAGDEGGASYALAEYALRAGDPSQALYHAGKAERLVAQSDPRWLRIQDIEQEAQNRLERSK